MIKALKYLKNNNPMYSDININENWIQTWQQLDQELYDGVFDIEEAGETSEMIKYKNQMKLGKMITTLQVMINVILKKDIVF